MSGWGVTAKAYSDMITLTLRSQLLSSQRLTVHPVPAGTFRYREQPLLKLGSLFSPRQSRSLGRLLATYLLTYRAPGQREKATYLLFGTAGTELRSSSIKIKRTAATPASDGEEGAD